MGINDDILLELNIKAVDTEYPSHQE